MQLDVEEREIGMSLVITIITIIQTNNIANQLLTDFYLYTDRV